MGESFAKVLGGFRFLLLGGFSGGVSVFALGRVLGHVLGGFRSLLCGDFGGVSVLAWAGFGFLAFALGQVCAGFGLETFGAEVR